LLGMVGLFGELMGFCGYWELPVDARGVRSSEAWRVNRKKCANLV
jgi:hypothetical protein